MPNNECATIGSQIALKTVNKEPFDVATVQTKH